jgi:lycopene cyclase domain-containing protein
MNHVTYLLVLLACLTLAVPLDPVFGCRVLRRPLTVLRALVPEVVIFGGWDVYAIATGQWSYDPQRLLGVTLPGRVPLEEALFFLVVPLCAILTFEAVQRLFPDSPTVPPAFSKGRP